MEKKLEGSPLNNFKGYNDFVLRVYKRLSAKDPLAVLYLDIDNLKAYNFHYGFEEGDKAIELLGKIAKDVLEDFGQEKGLGFYLGEDNFAILSAPLWTDPISRRIIQRFDEKILALYSEQDQSQGFIRTKDRKGKEIEIPLMSLSIGVVTNTKREISHLAEVNQIGFELLKYAKTFFGSNCVVDKRSYEEDLLPEKADDSLRTKRILIVEDDPDISEIITMVLSSEGYSVETALDGKSAIKKIAENSYHLALIDVILPDIEGLVVLGELKLKDPLSVGIIMTGYASFEGAIKAMREGAYDFLVKPLEMERLKITIKRGIEQQGLALHNRSLIRSLTRHTAELNKKVEEVLSLNEGLQALYLGTITTLAATLDAKDHYTQGHSERVGEYARAIAEKMGLSKEEIRIIQYACQLHDIGKIGIKDHILLKPGPLTEEERGLIQ
ncbi:response regulator, partial [bacterium]|nr:response regulator [bacterium]